MISEHVVKLAVDYLDQCVAENVTATLVGMHWYIDGRNKTPPLPDEVNEALKGRPHIGVCREKKSVVFSLNGAERTVTVEDMRQADGQYRKEFAIALKELRR